MGCNGTSDPFTGENIAAVLLAIARTDGTYEEIVREARQHGADVTKYALSKWISEGRKDLQAGRNETPLARFTQEFERRRDKYCGTEAARQREMDRALVLLEQTETTDGPAETDGNQESMPDRNDTDTG